MRCVADAFRRLDGLRLKDEAATTRSSLSNRRPQYDEIRALEARLPCPLPQDIRDALRVAKGLANGAAESFSLVDLEGYGLDEMLPHAYSMAHDGFGTLLGAAISCRCTTASGPVFTPATTPPCWPSRRPRSRSS